MLAKAYQLSRGNPIEDAIEMFRSLRQQVEAQGARPEVLGVVTTGYAKDILRDVFSADAALVETVAHAQSALHLYRDPHVIVDVGGQDIKIIVLRNGRVKDFRLNTQCSAGNGYFLQAIAQSFGYPVETFAETALAAREMPVFGYGCVLFLQSEIANVQRQGWRPEEILAGLAAVLPKNVFLYVAKAPNLARFGTRFVLQGGTQRNLAAVKAQVDFIRSNFHGQGAQPEIVLHEHCGEAGAIGAALEAARLWHTGRITSFIGLEAAERVSFQTRCDEGTRCHFCQNECLRTFIDVSTASEPLAPPSVVTGQFLAERRFVVAACEKGSAEDLARMRDIKAAEDAVKAATPNLVALAAREVWKSRRPPAGGRPAAGGVDTGGAHAPAVDGGAERRCASASRACSTCTPTRPSSPDTWRASASRGRNIVYSDVTTNEMYRAGASRGAIDPCFPSKVALAHVHNLLYVKHRRAPLGVIFFPMIDMMPVADRRHGREQRLPDRQPDAPDRAGGVHQGRRTCSSNRACGTSTRSSTSRSARCSRGRCSTCGHRCSASRGRNTSAPWTRRTWRWRSTNGWCGRPRARRSTRSSARASSASSCSAARTTTTRG